MAAKSIFQQCRTRAKSTEDDKVLGRSRFHVSLEYMALRQRGEWPEGRSFAPLFDLTVAMAAPRTPKAHVRILGTRLGRFVEFEFSLDEGVLAVELILPPAAFEEFCRAQNADVLPLSSETAEEIERAAWRAGHPGLLQRTLSSRDNR